MCSVVACIAYVAIQWHGHSASATDCLLCSSPDGKRAFLSVQSKSVKLIQYDADGVATIISQYIMHSSYHSNAGTAHCEEAVRLCSVCKPQSALCACRA